MYESAIQSVDIFRDLTRPQIEELYSWLERRDFSAGADIFQENSTPDGLYLLTEGTVTVVKSSNYGKFKLAEIEAPNFFGEMGLLSASPRSAGVRAQTNVVTGLLPYMTFRAKMAQNNLTALRIAVNLGELMCYRLTETNRQLATKTALIAKRRPH